MKKLLFLFILMLSPMLASAQTVSDVKNSGCLNETRGAESQRVPTIVLTKEGSVLSVQLLNYEENCCVEEFEVTSSISGGSDGAPLSLSISVVPDDEWVCDCICPFNVSFTVRDLEPNSFYLDCWWYKGLVKLTEGEALVLESSNRDQKESLYGEWMLVGYNDEGNWSKVDNYYVGHRHLSIEIPKEGYVMAYSMVNEIFVGLLTLNENEMIFDGDRRRLSTEVYCPIENNVFFETHICDIKFYQLEGNLLKLYYTDNDYFVFTSDFNDDEDTEAEYRPFVEEGKVWTYHYYNDMTGKDFYESLMVSGDTVVDDKSYKKIVDVTTGRVDCAIREEGRKVYATYPHYSGEKLIYDFGLNVGDTFQLYDDNNGSDPNAWATVVSVDTIVVGSRAFRALDVRSNDMKGWPNWWVEGIGGEYGLTENCLLLGNSYCFSSCKLGEDTLFTNHDFQTLGTIPSIETQTAYYYYKGGKIPLTQNENKVVVSIPKEYDGVCKRIRANLPVLNTITDQVFDSFIIPRSDFERLTSQDFWEEDAKSVVLTSSYYTEDKTEVFETPYLNVKLKKEEDASLLASYAERYRLKIDGNSSYMPLWYILHVTPESEKSPLKCANEIFESGEFASAVPDLSSDDDFEIGVAYRPFVEDGKVWKVGTIPTVSGNPVQVVDYYYFAGDTIVGGKTCKQMMCQKYVSPGFSDAAPSLTKVGAWYEEDKKVYFYDERKQSVMLKYDFTIWDNGSVQLIDDYPPFIIGPKQTGGLEGFKGVYRDVMINQDVRITTWLEGVGGIDGPTRNAYPEAADRMPEFLMSCTVGDEVIYLNDAYEDGATPEGARKDRIDFTHTIKIRPKTRMMEEVEAKSLYGEYNNQQLGIHLNALDDAYQVSITDEAGKVVYEKTVNAGNIVGLNIDISAYAKGRYTVTVENSNESFTGEIDTRTTGIEENVRIEKFKNGSIYNLQGQRINSLRKGLNIVNGRKVYKY